MGKSIRSKIKKRFRTVKRKLYDQEIGNAKLQNLSHKLQNTPGVHDPVDIPKKNAFLYPEDAAAAFPQYLKPTLVDFRSGSVDFAGFEFRGSARKNKVEEPQTEAVETEMNEIPEEGKGEDDEMIEINEEDLMADFGSMGIAATKRIRKKKFGGMDTEGSGFIPFSSKKKQQQQQAKNKGCRKSRKIMKF